MGMFSSDEREEIFAAMEYRDRIEKLEKENKKLKEKNEKLEKVRQLHTEIVGLYEELYDDSELRTIVLQDFLNRQQRIFDNKVKHGFNTTNIYQEARYILEEVTELMRAIEKNDRENMIEELADIVIFAYGCTEVARLGDLDAKIFEKMALNENRKYMRTPEGDFVKTGLNS